MRNSQMQKDGGERNKKSNEDKQLVHSPECISDAVEWRFICLQQTFLATATSNSSAANTSTQLNYYFAHSKDPIAAERKWKTKCQLLLFASEYEPIDHGTGHNWQNGETTANSSAKVKKKTTSSKKNRDVFKAAVWTIWSAKYTMNEVKWTLNSGLRAKRYNSIKAVKNDL